MKLARLRNARTLRASSWDRTGRNNDRWTIKPGETRVLADIRGIGCITHIWMTQLKNYRDCVLRFTWDNARHASVLCPLGDFFGLGHAMVNSYDSRLFSACAYDWRENKFEVGVALNCYAPMPFRERALVEIINEGKNDHLQYFYIDYELHEDGIPEDMGYFHAEFRRENPCDGWGHELGLKHPRVVKKSNVKRDAWNNNYVILETQGRGHYIGCNLSVTDFHGDSWNEGDDMIWVDGYKWPPDLHGTGAEDYFNQAWGLQANAFHRYGSSIHWKASNGYQTCYVQHIENPVHFRKSIKVTIEHGHANHLSHDMSSVAYWYAEKPARAIAIPPVHQRKPIMRQVDGKWIHDAAGRTRSVNALDRKAAKALAGRKKKPGLKG
jgi:hypothetical protein